jgi:hypothetical protein
MSRLDHIISATQDRSMILSVASCWSDWIDDDLDWMLPVAITIMRIAGMSARIDCQIAIMMTAMMMDVM